MATTTVTIRVDEKLKRQATEAFKGMGLSLVNGISVYLTRVAAANFILFKVEVPAFTSSSTFGLTAGAAGLQFDIRHLRLGHFLVIFPAQLNVVLALSSQKQRKPHVTP